MSANLPLSSALVPSLVWLERVGSTNTELASRVTTQPPAAVPHLTVVATDNQVQGKGRLGRTWTAPAGGCLAVSVLVRPQTPSGRAISASALGWVGLLAGLAMTRACASVLPHPERVALKWPNDVLIGQRKVCGVLSELVVTPHGPAVVVGTGVNIFLTEEQLPVPTATSLALEGAAADLSVDALLAAYLTEFSRLIGVFLAAEADIVGSGLLEQVRHACDTIGRSVRVELPSGESPVGEAVDIDAEGSLVVALGAGLAPLVVAAGDVTHLRVIMNGDHS
jgi:BirA family biotin operon repressor/biotin-[acetyl-CoA-carboxylase] ligase